MIGGGRGGGLRIPPPPIRGKSPRKKYNIKGVLKKISCQKISVFYLHKCQIERDSKFINNTGCPKYLNDNF